MEAIVFSVLAVLCWSGNAIMASKATERVDPTTLNFVSAFPATVILLAAVLTMGEAPRLAGISMPEFVLLGLTGLANYAVGRNLYYVSIQKIGAGRTVPIANLSVLAAPILASLLLGELFTARIGVGMVLVFAGVYLLTQRRR